MAEQDEDNLALRDRLAECCGDVSISEIARSVDMSRETVRRFIRTGRPSAQFLMRLCRTREISPTWLLLGQGAPELTQSPPPDLSTIETRLLVEVVAQRLNGQP